MRINYYARLATEHSRGIQGKIVSTVDAINKITAQNIIAKEKVFFEKSAFKGAILLLKEMIQDKPDIIFLRSNKHFMLLYLPFLMYLRFVRGCKIVIDIPTPLVNLVQENLVSSNSKLIRILKAYSLYMVFPLSLLVANRVLEYGGYHSESRWFRMFLKKKITATFNAADVHSIEKVPCIKSYDGSLTIIGVAFLAPWHGFERLIESIALHNHNSEKKVFFDIVGEGRAKDELVELTNKLELNDYVRFRGVLTGDSLSEAFQSAHVALCSLGLYKIGLDKCSILKAREYCARGLPFIISGNDPMIDNSLPFVFEVQNNESTFELSPVVDWFEGIENSSVTSDYIRSYALENLDITAKVRNDLNGFLEFN